MQISENERRERAKNEEGWYALYTKPRHEFKAALQIEEAGVQYYMPTIKRLKQWSDRKKKVTEPLLRGYIFIFSNEKGRITALEQESVVRCVFDHGRPAVIPDWQIQNIKNLLSNEGDFFVNEGLVPGAKVIIKEGPFEGVIGRVREDVNGKTLAVSLELLNRTIIAKLPKESLFELIKE